MLHKYNCLTFKKFCQKTTVYIEEEDNGELALDYH